MEEDQLDLYGIPLFALRPPTREVIVRELHSKKIIPSDDKLPRDYRGLAHLAGIPSPNGENPVRQLLAAWETVPNATFGLLKQFLGQLDRWDIVDDIDFLIRDDAKAFLTRKPSSSSSGNEANEELDKLVLTFEDLQRQEQGLEPQVYDALLLYADEDLHFACEMVQRLERAGCKICLKDNLVGGLSFEHQGVMRLINERCRRVIVIVSQNFINSNLNRFFVLYAQAMSIERDRRIIIPCIYGEFPFEKMPMEIKHMFKLDFNRREKYPNYDFWGQLQASVTSHSTLRALPGLTRTALTIHELSSRSIENSLPQCARSGQTVADEPSRSGQSIAVHKRSSSLLSLSTHSSEESAVSVKEKQHNIKSPKAIFKTLFTSKKKSKKQAFAVAF